MRMNIFLISVLAIIVLIILQSCHSKKSIYFLITNTNQRKLSIPLEIEIEGKNVYNDTIVNRNISPDYDEFIYTTKEDSIVIFLKSPYLIKPERRVLFFNKNEKYVFVTFNSKLENYKINKNTGMIYPIDTIDEFGFYPVDEKPVLM